MEVLSDSNSSVKDVIQKQLELVEFDTLEYSVFGAMLGMSVLIGVYFGFIKGGQDTVDGYLLGGKELGLFPISMSLISGHVSGITMLGMPAEVYTYGTQYMVLIFCIYIVGILCAFVFLPVFYELQVISVYEYMELRFNKAVRKMVSFFFALILFLQTPVVIYGPALALNQVSGLNVYSTAFVICGICIFYTTFGGLKAVVWTDTLQAVVMVISATIVAVIGTRRVGGWTAIWEAADRTERLEFFNLDPDPRLRMSFWVAIIGTLIFSISNSPFHPSCVQRFVSLNTLTKARWSVFFFIIGISFLYFLSCFMGLVINAEYEHCDPKVLGLIKTNDQILPYFVTDVTGSYRGFPGLFLAGVVAAALSTMSANMNTVSGTIYEDLLEPLIGKTSEAQASRHLKILSAVFGILCLGMLLILEHLGSLIELTAALGGLTSGSILGIFLLGMFIPHANSLGAITGGACGLFALLLLFLGSRAAIAAGDLVYPVKPVSIDGCSFNITGMKLNPPKEAVTGRAFPLFEISIFYYVPIGCTITMLVGLVVSYLSGPNRLDSVDRRLLSPVIRPLVPVYKPVLVDSSKEPVVVFRQQQS